MEIFTGTKFTYIKYYSIAVIRYVSLKISFKLSNIESQLLVFRLYKSYLNNYFKVTIKSSSLKISQLFKNFYVIIAFFRKALLEHGIFHQIRVDHGKEFYLVLGMQEQLQHLRNNNTEIIPYQQTQSKQVSMLS